MGPKSLRAGNAADLVASFRSAWLPRLAEPRDRAAVTAVFLALALVGAPLTGSIRAVCDQCPVTCPMHQPAKAKQRKPSCHAAGPSAAHEEGTDAGPSRGVGFTRPPCSHHGVVPGVALAPMILPGAVRSEFVPVTQGLRDPAPLGHVRANDPPDTPPPIVSA
jgi:hypothetical protein